MEIGNSGASQVEGKPVLKPRAMPRYTRQSFWIGLPVVLLFAVISWMGVRYAAGQISTERIVYQRGVLITGTVEEKINYRQTEAGEQTHYVTYNFRTPADLTVRNTIIFILWGHIMGSSLPLTLLFKFNRNYAYF
jgi:hypothetical protein